LLLGDRYRAIKPIGQGGFGKTFLAVDEYKPSKPYCVIKQFFPQAQGTNSAEKAAELFEQEAVRLDDLGKHPQIPELLAYFTQDRQQYLVQEFIDGKNIAQELEDRGRFSETDIRALLNDLLQVLQFVHERQVIHRDIKPANIIRRANGQLVLVDFGAAKYAAGTALFKTGTNIGSPEYLPPEQGRGKAVFASDLYSLGVTCIHLLTNVSPFELFDINEDVWVWRQYLADNPVSEELSRLLDKLIENAINRRYQSVEEVLLNLNSVETGNFTSVQPAPVPPHYPQPSFPDPQPATTSLGDKSPPTPPPLSQAWRCAHTLTGHTDCVYSVAFDPQRFANSLNGELLASGGMDYLTIKLWEPSSSKLIGTLFGHSNEVWSVVFSPDGNILASGSDDKTIKLWSPSTGKLIRILIGHSESVLSVAFSPDGKILASGSIDNTIKLWETSTGKVISTLKEHSRSVVSVTFSPDGETLASGSDDKTIKLWHHATGKLINTLTGHSKSVVSVAFSPDGEILASGSDDKTIKLWHPATGKLINTLTGHSKSVYAVAFAPQRSANSPDDEILASGSDDKTIKLWHPATGKLIDTLTGHSGPVYTVAFAPQSFANSPNGRILASGSMDKTIKIWRCD
jgi:WD40 repeat protein